MAGRILIYDGIAANRIILRCKLSAACYDVIQADSLSDLRHQALTQTADMVILDADENLAASLKFCQDIAVAGTKRALAVLLLASNPTSALRVAAFEAGAWDVLAKPIHDDLLMATLRRFLRQNNSGDDLRNRGARVADLGFLEEDLAFASPGNIAFVTQSAQIGEAWLAALDRSGNFRFALLDRDDALSAGKLPSVPDVYVIRSKLKRARDGLRLLSELRCRVDTRGVRTIIVLDPSESTPSALFEEAAMALDLGADDVLLHGFHPAELACKLEFQMAHKRQFDRVRKSVTTGMRLAAVDPLTGLYNRRYALPRLQRLMQSAQATRAPLSLMVLDLDRFKSVNDTFGHMAGDAVLVEVSRHLTECLRPQDLVARIGGEEFLVALPETGRDAANGVAQKLRELIRSSPVNLPDRQGLIRVTMSIGVAVTEGQRADVDMSVEALIDRADRALFAAKADGRDQVTFARPAA